MKKQNLITSLALVMSLTLCTGASVLAAETETLSASGDQTEIVGDLKIWMEDETYAEALIAAFNEKYPDVNVECEKVDAINATSKLSSDGPVGSGPDVLWCSLDMKAINDGIVEPLPEDMQARIEEKCNEAAVKSITSEGKLYGIPFELNNLALYYNKDLVDKAPETYEEIFDFAKSYNDSANGKYALRMFPNYVYDNYIYLSAFGYRIFGENSDDWKNPGFDSAEMAEGLNFFKSLREIYDMNTADSTQDAVIGAFNRGEVPYVVYGPWGLAEAKASGVNFGTVKIPTINGEQPYSFSSAQVVSVSSYAENFDAAFAFAEFMVSDEAASILYETRGTLTSLKDISSVPEVADDEYLQGFSDQAVYTYPVPQITEMNYAWTPMQTMLELVWDDKLTVEEAQKKAMEDYEQQLNGVGESMYE